MTPAQRGPGHWCAETALTKLYGNAAAEGGVGAISRTVQSHTIVEVPAIASTRPSSKMTSGRHFKMWRCTGRNGAFVVALRDATGDRWEVTDLCGTGPVGAVDVTIR